MTEHSDPLRTLAALQAIAQSDRPTTTSATVQVNAGGVGVWLATTACLVMLAVALMQRIEISELRREQSEHRHQLNAIYMMAPHLKPAERAQ